jgi:hypothetical protein
MFPVTAFNKSRMSINMFTNTIGAVTTSISVTIVLIMSHGVASGMAATAMLTTGNILTGMLPAPNSTVSVWIMSLTGKHNPCDDNAGVSDVIRQQVAAAGTTSGPVIRMRAGGGTAAKPARPVSDHVELQLAAIIVERGREVLGKHQEGRQHEALIAVVGAFRAAAANRRRVVGDQLAAGLAWSDRQRVGRVGFRLAQGAQR